MNGKTWETIAEQAVHLGEEARALLAHTPKNYENYGSLEGNVSSLERVGGRLQMYAREIGLDDVGNARD